MHLLTAPTAIARWRKTRRAAGVRAARKKLAAAVSMEVPQAVTAAVEEAAAAGLEEFELRQARQLLRGAAKKVEERKVVAGDALHEAVRTCSKAALHDALHEAALAAGRSKGADTHDPLHGAVADNEPVWSTHCSFELCGDGQTQTYKNMVVFVNKSHVSSVAEAVGRLNGQTRPGMECSERWLAVFSREHRAWFVLYRSGDDRAREDAKEHFFRHARPVGSARGRGARPGPFRALGGACAKLCGPRRPRPMASRRESAQATSSEG